jgi:hypothetical protein
MNAASDLLAAVEAAGGRVRVMAGDVLRVETPTPLSNDLLARLRQAKPAILAALGKPVGASPAEWHARHAEALAFWRAFHPAEEAARIAWGQLVNLWHKRYGELVPPEICAGCRQRITNCDALALGDGTRVHFETLDCVIAYGIRWRGIATQALTAMGLRPPPTDESS